MKYFQTESGAIINEEGVVVPMDESSPLYANYLEFLNKDGEVYPTDKLSNDEVLQQEASKIKNYRSKIYELYEMLYASSLARALGKQGQGLSAKQLESLQIGYGQKKEIAEVYLQDGTITNQTLFDTIHFEESTDFEGEKLDSAVAYFNAVYAANIPTENITRVQQYCYIILVKYKLGIAYWNILTSYCESFRSILLTNLDNLEFERIDARIELSKTITNSTSLEEIETLKLQFDAL